MLWPYIRLFKTTKRGMELFMLHSISWPNFPVWLPLLLEILSNMCILIICFTVYDAINFEFKFSFLIKPFPYMTKMSGQKFTSWEQKVLLIWNKKHSLSLSKGVQLLKIVSNLRIYCAKLERESNFSWEAEQRVWHAVITT